MLSIDTKAARATWTAALTLLALAGVYAIRGTLIVFTVALLFAYLLSPLVNQIARRIPGKNRVPALAITYLLVLGLLGAIAVTIGSQVAAEARELVTQPPDVRSFLERLVQAHPMLAPVIAAAQGRIREQLGEIVSAAPRISLHVLAASANAIDLVIVPILSFFMLKDGREIRRALMRLIPEGPERDAANRAVVEVHDLLLEYMRALFLLCCTVLVVFGVVLGAMGVPYALLLGTVAFLCEFVPLMGPLTAAAVILSVSAIGGYAHIWWLAAFLGAFRIAQDYAIAPKLMSRGVELHPLAVIFGVFAGAELGGVAGVFLSVPVLALLRLILLRSCDNSPR